MTEKQKYQIDNILSGNTYYRNTGKKWTKENLLDVVSSLLNLDYDYLVKKGYNKEQLATMYITNKSLGEKNIENVKTIKKLKDDLHYQVEKLNKEKNKIIFKLDFYRLKNEELEDELREIKFQRKVKSSTN